MDYIEAKRFQWQYICAECGKEPQLFPEEGGGYEVRCQNPAHRGLIHPKSYVQARLEKMIIDQANIIKEVKNGLRTETGNP